MKIQFQRSQIDFQIFNFHSVQGAADEVTTEAFIKFKDICNFLSRNFS